MTWFHVHRWVLVTSHNAVHTYIVGGKKVPCGDVTVMLYRCSTCGRHRTDEIDGVWTTQQLRGGPSLHEMLMPPERAS